MTAPVVKIDTTSQRFAGSRQPDPDLMLLHTTEGGSWPPYAGGNEAPHATVKPLPGRGIEVRVHRPPTDYGKALANREGGVETNRRGVWQIELMGTCDPSARGRLYYWPEADDVVLAALAQYVRPTMIRFNIPAKAVAPFLPYPKSYGSKGGQRLTFAQWNTVRGICGHQHAPENDHGDPGAFPVAKLIQLINQEDDDMPTAQEIADAVINAVVGEDINETERKLGWSIAAILRDGQRQNAALAALKAPDVAALAAAVAAALPASEVTAEDIAKALVVELVNTKQDGAQ